MAMVDAKDRPGHPPAPTDGKDGTGGTDPRAETWDALAPGTRAADRDDSDDRELEDPDDDQKCGEDDDPDEKHEDLARPATRLGSCRGGGCPVPRV